MPVDRGSLKPADEAKVRKWYSYLLDQLDSQYLSAELYEKEVISKDDIEAIDCKETRRERAKVLLDKLLLAGPRDAYVNFVTALNENGYEHVAEKLESADSTAEPEEKPYDPFEDFPQDVLEKVITDASASRLAFQIGTGWEDLVLGLGVTKVAIDKEKARGRGDETGSITNLLIHWRQKNGKVATWKLFLEALKELYEDNRITIDVEKVKIVAQKQS